MLQRVYQTKFVKDVERIKKRGKDLKKLSLIIELLLEEETLAAKYKNHKLIGDYKNHWECHIEPDWLLVYVKTKTEIVFARTGTHSDLF
jgi:mRNA interferase YafQ